MNEQQGLSNSSVEKIYQDHLGFIWIGTSDGLNRYDGYNFEIYLNNSTDSLSLSNSFVNAIYEDRRQRLWIGTNDGLNYFDREKNRFVKYRHSAKNNQTISNSIITSITGDKDGNLWIGTNGGGINMLTTRQTGFKHFFHRNGEASINSDKIKTLFMDRSGLVWAGTSKGLCRYNADDQRFYPVKGFDQSIFTISESGNQLWVGTEFNGLFTLNRQTGSIKHYVHRDNDIGSLGSDLVRAITVDSKGNTWVGCTNGGLNLFKPETGSFYKYVREPENAFSLSQKSVSDIFEDRQNNLWVGVPRGGINLYMPQANKFKFYHEEALKTGLSYGDVRSFYEDLNHTIWVGVDGGGINLFSPQKGFQHNFRHEPHNAASLSCDAILNISGDKKGNIWVSTFGGGLNLYERLTNSFKVYRHNPALPGSISSDYVTKAFEDSRLNFWVATNKGLNLFDRKTQQFRVVKSADASGNGCIGQDIIDIEEDHDQHVWILTLDGGLNRYDLLTGKYRHYFNEKATTQGLAVGFTDTKGRFWIGNKGLYLYDKSLDQFHKFPAGNTLSEEYIKAIQQDEQGNIWLSTSKGITKLNVETGTTISFNSGDGLQNGEFEVKSSLKTTSGELYFGGINGFNSFMPAEIGVNRYDAPIYITGLEIDNITVNHSAQNSPLIKDIVLSDELNLSYRQNAVTFIFAALNYVIPENNTYVYKLDKVNQNWIQNGTSHKAIYTNLDPGTYTFHVKAANNDGYWSTHERTLKITIYPPYYATWWFRALAFVLLTIAVYWYLRFRHRQAIRLVVERKNEELHQLQTQFFTNISHEFRTPLSLILGPLEKIKEADVSGTFLPLYQTIDRNVNRLLNLIHELMDFSKVASGVLKLKVAPVDLHQFLQEIVGEFKYMSSSKQLELDTSGLKEGHKHVFDPDILEKIILNLLNNAFKYTNSDARIKIEAFSSKAQIHPLYQHKVVVESEQRFISYFYIQLTDNGIGISNQSIQHLFERYFRVNSSHMGSGVGLAFIKSLTLLHKGNITVYSELHKGTQIIIALPDQPQAYTTEERQLETAISGSVGLELLPEPGLDDNGINKDNSVRRERILLVEDNYELRNFYKHTLADQYQLFEAEDGQQALDIARQEFVDLIITDLMMPVMDGITLCKAIREELETSHIPLIMLTAKNRPEVQLESAESGADLYLTKPVSLRLLQVSIRNIFNHQSKLREIYIRDYYSEARDLTNTAKDRDFIDKLCKIIESQLVNYDMDVECVCQEIGMSRSKLYQKVKSITGQSIVEFIRSFRLKKAIQIMTHEDVSINEVIYRVGIQTHSHFTKSFKKEFGKTPSQFLKEIQRQAN